MIVQTKWSHNTITDIDIQNLIQIMIWRMVTIYVLHCFKTNCTSFIIVLFALFLYDVWFDANALIKIKYKYNYVSWYRAIGSTHSYMK